MISERTAKAYDKVALIEFYLGGVRITQRVVRLQGPWLMSVIRRQSKFERRGTRSSMDKDSYPQVQAVIQFANGMLMVFDMEGKQIPGLQGHVDKVGKKVAAIFPRDRWEHKTWRVPPDGWTAS